MAGTKVASAGTTRTPLTAVGTDYVPVDTGGTPAKMLLSWLSPGYLNVKGYGVKGDGKQVTDASISGTTVTSATAAFTSADVGKVCWAVAGGLFGGSTQLAQTTITAYNSATSVTVGATGTTGSSNTFVWGTDDTTNLQTAWDAALSAQRPLYCPKGIYLVSGSIGGGDLSTAGTFHLFGDGIGQTVFRLMPTAAWISGKIGIISCPANSLYNVIHDIEINGGHCSRLATQTSAVTATYAAGLYWNGRGACERVMVTGFGSTNGFDFLSFCGLNLAGATRAAFRSCIFKQCGVNIKMVGTNYGNTFYGCATASNGSFVTQAYHNIQINDANTLTLFHGCEIDEATYGAGATVSVEVAATVDRLMFDKTTLYIMDSKTGINAANGGGSSSTILLRDSELIPYGGNTNCTAANVQASSTLTVYDSKITGNGTGKAVTGAGTLKKANSTITGTVDISTNTTLY